MEERCLVPCSLKFQVVPHGSDPQTCTMVGISRASPFPDSLRTRVLLITKTSALRFEAFIYPDPYGQIGVDGAGCNHVTLWMCLKM